MVRSTKISRKQDKIVSKLDGKERAFLSIILMNKGFIPGPKLKRIFLEKYTYWVMQSTEKKLLTKGLLHKKGGIKNGETLGYEVPEKYIDLLSKSFISKSLFTTKEKQLEPIFKSCCGEYSILWYLWQIESIISYGMQGSKSRVIYNRTYEKKVEEILGIEKESVRFLMEILMWFSTNSSYAEKVNKKWSEILDSPHKVVKEIFKMAFESLREEGELGREDIGKDNIDFLFEELAVLKNGRWYSLNDFVSNIRGTLFKCNQPFRWVHFDEESVWNILHKKLKMLGVIETALSKNGVRFFSTTILSSYCLGKIPEKKILRTFSSRKGKLMIHPNFEVTMVSKELNPKTSLELAMFSHPTKLDTVSVFRISRESVREGIRLGLTTDEMTSFLKENSKGKIPQNVEYSIGDWGG